MTWNLLKHTIDKILKSSMWNKVKREHALLSNSGILEKTYLTIKHDNSGSPYFVKDENYHVKKDKEAILKKRIPIYDFDITNLKEEDKMLFYENGRYVSNHAEAYFLIALKRNGICDSANTVLIKDIVTLGKAGLSKLHYSDTETLSDKSILLAELCLKEMYGVVLE